MAARTGMTSLLLEIRRMTNAGATDHTVNGVVYWTDDQLQERLDRTRSTVKRVAVYPQADYINGAYSYTEYPLPAELQWIEEQATGSGWALRDSSGADAPSYTVNYEARIITFAADTANAVYYLDCRTYDLYAAAAAIWEEKAGIYEDLVNWSTDNHRVDASTQRDYCMQQAAQYRRRGRSAVGFSRLFRTDEAR